MERIESIPVWTAVGAAQIGRSHVLEGTVCQDKTCILVRSGILTAALADGAGSASLSHLGAAAVTRRICELLCDRFDAFYDNPVGAEVKQEILLRLHEVLWDCSQANKCPIQELASTLLAVAVRGARYLVLHIGDGVIGYVKNGRIRVASAPDNGEYANETTFVTCPNAFTALRISKGESKDIEGFVLMSDGSEASLYSRSEKALAPVLARLVYRLGITSAEYIQPSLEQSLKSPIARKTMDDCSLVLIAKHERSYRDLTREELIDFFSLEEQDPQTWEACIEKYVQVLDLLDAPCSAGVMAERFPDENIDSFAEKWLDPLLDMGYVCRTESDEYVRMVTAGMAHGEMKRNEEDKL